MRNPVSRVVKSVAIRYRRAREGVSDAMTLRRSTSVDIASCRSVCLALGPYRNLTTLTAATLFLHPRCQVLNHAGKRIYGNRHVDFLADYSRERLDRFVRFAIEISAGGRRGDHGGSITRSHAFDTGHAMGSAFEESGGQLLKERIDCLFWKESLITANHIRDEAVDLDALFAADERPRFLLPVRNPMDCAVSNLKTGHASRFRGLTNDSPLLEVLDAVLDEIFFVAELEARHPERFFHFFEHSMDRDMLVRLAAFLGLEPDESWIETSLRVLVSKASYDHPPEVIARFREGVERRGERFPELSRQLLAFAGGS